MARQKIRWFTPGGLPYSRFYILVDHIVYTSFVISMATIADQFRDDGWSHIIHVFTTSSCVYVSGVGDRCRYKPSAVHQLLPNHPYTIPNDLQASELTIG